MRNQRHRQTSVAGIDGGVLRPEPTAMQGQVVGITLAEHRHRTAARTLGCDVYVDTAVNRGRVDGNAVLVRLATERIAVCSANSISRAVTTCQCDVATIALDAAAGNEHDSTAICAIAIGDQRCRQLAAGGTDQNPAVEHDVARRLQGHDSVATRGLGNILGNCEVASYRCHRHIATGRDAVDNTHRANG